jgi:hypothetical protein
VVERALVWLTRNNPHYASIEIDTAEMETWEASSSYGVPHQIYERLQREEPSAWEKTRTAQLVPQTERGLEAGDEVDVREVLDALHEEQAARPDGMEDGGDAAGGANVVSEDNMNQNSEVIQEVSASGMFALNALPDVEDTEKL